MGASKSGANLNEEKQEMSNLIRLNSSKGEVTKENFNHFLAVCTNSALNKVAWTYFSDRMFDSLNTSGGITISQDNIHTYLQLLQKNDIQQLIYYTFRMYDTNKNGYISRKQFISFIEGVWLSAAGLVGKSKKAHVKEIRQWAESCKNKLSKMSGGVFDRVMPKSIEGIDKQEFRMWLKKGEIKCITIECMGDVGMLPLSLLALSQM